MSYTSSSADMPPDRLLSPNLALGSFNGARYPNQFFDLAQQYMPPTIKELFRWCTFYFYNSPLIGAAMKKVSRYPITDLIIEDVQDSVREVWKKILVDELKTKIRLMEINLDCNVYGNAFVSVHLPFTRFLICKKCRHRQPIQHWSWSFSASTFSFTGTCPKCGNSGAVEVKDHPYKDRKAVRLIRWNPENIHIKFNEYTGRYIYMYSVPGKLKNAILRGDKDILEDIPLIVLEALQKRRLIRFNNDAIFHLKATTLAEQDQGWGKPAILHVLKDMYYFYTLRRAQEAIALEHIVPFDIIYPMPNAQQDPYIHTNLAGWRNQIETIIKRHRHDPNFKGIMPIPVGFGRLGGDGKALLLGPELQYLTQTVVGGMGIPQEFLFGGLNWTGSSISLRTLENDFIQNRTQLLDLVYWIKDKMRVWFDLPDVKKIRFADFRMADDVQKNQQVIGLNAAQKLSNQTMLTELGYDYDEEVKRQIAEIFVQNYINDLLAKGSAKSQGEANVISYNYQEKINEMAQNAQMRAQEQMAAMGMGQPQQTDQFGQPVVQGESPPTAEEAQTGPGNSPEWGTKPAGGGKGGPTVPQIPGGSSAQQAGAQAQIGMDPAQLEIQSRIDSWATKLVQMSPTDAQLTLGKLKSQMPDIGRQVETRYRQLQIQNSSGMNVQQTMQPLPEQRAPRRMEQTGA